MKPEMLGSDYLFRGDLRNERHPMKELAMKELRYASIGLAALLSFGGVEAGASPGGSMWITDGLTVAQRQEIWRGVAQQAVKESSPASLKAAIGQSLPNSVRLQPMPKEVGDEIPAVIGTRVGEDGHARQQGDTVKAPTSYASATPALWWLICSIIVRSRSFLNDVSFRQSMFSTGLRNVTVVCLLESPAWGMSH
jgi:hypothetical protein